MDKTEKEQIQEIHQALFGVKGTDDRGFCGDLKAVKEIVSNMNVCFSRVKSKQDKIIGGLIALSVLTSLLGGWTLSSIF